MVMACKPCFHLVSSCQSLAGRHTPSASLLKFCGILKAPETGLPSVSAFLSFNDVDFGVDNCLSEFLMDSEGCGINHLISLFDSLIKDVDNAELNFGSNSFGVCRIQQKVRIYFLVDENYYLEVPFNTFKIVVISWKSYLEQIYCLDASVGYYFEIPNICVVRTDLFS